MTQVVKDVVTWLKQWFPLKSEVVAKSQGSGNASKNVVTDSSGDVTIENKVSCGTGLSFDSSVTNKINHSNSVTAQSTKAIYKVKHDAQGHITESTAITSSDLPSHSHDTSEITDTHYTDYTHINPSGQYQSSINSAIDTAIGTLQSIKAIDVVSTLPTASASTMGKLYIISEQESGVNKVNVYYTERTGTSPNYSYSWHKMDTDILDNLSVAWNDVTGKPSFSTVATSGSYNDLSDKPTIPDISTKSDKTATIGTTITLVDAGETNEGCIIFNTIS